MPTDPASPVRFRVAFPAGVLPPGTVVRCPGCGRAMYPVFRDLPFRPEDAICRNPDCQTNRASEKP